MIERLDAVVVIVGAASPLGRALALDAAARGARVMVVDTQEKTLGELVGEIVYGGGRARHAVGDPCDVVSIRAAVSKAVETFERVDAVVFVAEEAPEVAIGHDGDRLATYLTRAFGSAYAVLAVAMQSLPPDGAVVFVPGMRRRVGSVAAAIAEASVVALAGAVDVEIGRTGPRICRALTVASAETDHDVDESVRAAGAALAELLAQTQKPARDDPRGNDTVGSGA